VRIFKASSEGSDPMPKEGEKQYGRIRKSKSAAAVPR
jgi:hypothetical protein